MLPNKCMQRVILFTFVHLQKLVWASHILCMCGVKPALESERSWAYSGQISTPTSPLFTALHSAYAPSRNGRKPLHEQMTSDHALRIDTTCTFTSIPSILLFSFHFQSQIFQDCAIIFRQWILNVVSNNNFQTVNSQSGQQPNITSYLICTQIFKFTHCPST